jgi:hydroxyethylthiazole kinase-like uncharacterized protein yjeF
MIRILSSKQIRAVDAYTIEHEPILSINLMERASREFVNWFVERFDVTHRIGIVCGTGNNGGDGLAISRLLREWNYRVHVWIVRGASETEDFNINLDRLKGRIEPMPFLPGGGSDTFVEIDVIIDALFGSGLSRPADGLFAEAIRAMNETDCVRIAVDIPSGLRADEPSSGEIFHAHHTVSFQTPKLAFLFPSNHQFVGEWSIVDIGLDKHFIKQQDVARFVLTQRDIKRRLRKRGTFDHKGSNGHVLLVSGSYGKTGATVLSSRAALRAGTGLLTVRVPSCGYVVLQSSVPEAMLLPDSNENIITSIPELESYSAVGVGPGLGTADVTAKALEHLLRHSTKPIVIDADALNIISSHRNLLHIVSAGSILTPHPKEFERLAGKWSNDFEKLDKQIALAKQLKSIVVVKGAFTSIASPDGRVYFNSTGNPGMASGGTGDVLTGILTSLLGQGYESVDAAIVGVYLHGLSGDLAAADLGFESLIASDIIGYLPHAFQKIRNSGKKNQR